MKDRLITIGIIFVAALMFFLLFSITGCATKYKYEKGDTSFAVTSYREFRRIEVKYGDLHILASGVTDDTAEAMMGITETWAGAATGIGTRWIDGTTLRDMTGQPRDPTQAEMAALFTKMESTR